MGGGQGKAKKAGKVAPEETGLREAGAAAPAPAAPKAKAEAKAKDKAQGKAQAEAKAQPQAPAAVGSGNHDRQTQEDKATKHQRHPAASTDVQARAIQAMKDHHMTLQGGGGQGCVAAYGGKIFASHCREGYSLDMRRNIHSCTKTFTGLLYVIAESRGEAPKLDTPLKQIFPDYHWDEVHERKRKLTVRHIFEMTEGFNLPMVQCVLIHEIQLEKGLQAAAHKLLDIPIDREPGEKFKYHFQVTSDLLAKILETVLKKDLATYARQRLFEPMGLNHLKWPGGKACIGSDGLELSLREMIMFGTMIAQDGEWEGKQLVDKLAMQRWKQAKVFQHLWRDPDTGGIRAAGIWGQIIMIQGSYVVAMHSTDDGEFHEKAAQTKVEAAIWAAKRVMSACKPPPAINHPDVVQALRAAMEQHKCTTYHFLASFRGTTIIDDANGEDGKDRHVLGSGYTLLPALIYKVAQGRGEAPKIDTPLSGILTQYAWGEDRKREITVSHLLKMTDGLAATGPEAWQDHLLLKKNDPVTFALDRPLKRNPGTSHNYNGLSSNLLAFAVQEATKMNLEDYANEHLFAPLGIERVSFPKCKNGLNLGGLPGPNGTPFSASELMKVFEMMRQEGSFDGKQVINRGTMKGWTESIKTGDFKGLRRMWGHFLGVCAGSLMAGFTDDWCFTCVIKNADGKESWKLAQPLIEDVIGIADSMRSKLPPYVQF